MNAIVHMPVRAPARPTLVPALDARDQRLFAPSDHDTVKVPVREGLWEKVLLAPVNDMLARPGKAIRARLLDAGYRLVSPHGRAPAVAGELVEILHAGSLIVDDIEDDSKMRRGKKAIHKVHGVPLALNAGNFMYFVAMDAIARLGLSPDGERVVHAETVRMLLDCHRGQALDLGLRIGDVTRTELPGVVAETSLLKSGALVAYSMALGARLAGGDDDQIAAARELGRELGLALQQLDDLGNLSPKCEAKKRFEDLREGKLTWPWVWAAETLPALDFGRLENVARLLRDPSPGTRINPRALGERLLAVSGEHRHRFIAQRLRGLANAIAPHFPDGSGLQEVQEQIKRLEESYV